MEAKDYLKQVERIDVQIRNKLTERQQWKDIALGVTANVGGERVQASASQQKMAAAIEKCVDMEEEINGLIDKLIEKKKDVITTIEQLYSPTEYDILHKRYIQFLPLKEIADNYKREYNWVTTTHGRALKNVQNILDRK